MPERRPVAGAKGERIPGGIARERQPGRRGEDAGARWAFAKLVAPADVPSLIIDRSQHAFALYVLIAARPAVSAVLRLEEVDPIRILRAHDQQPGLRIEARRSIVG